ncbi:MAG: hypothetical protein KF789_11970 [Bdellovibrionaceae bacterium]|nr:hypothetical protein [Pseudobdellovibrionaceae bacterium]
MKSLNVLASVFISVCALSAEAGQICMSDGQCIEDPSLTVEAKPKVDLPSGLNLDSTGTWTMIQVKCNKDNYNKGTVKYSSPDACLQENIAELNARAQTVADKAKKSGSNSGSGGGGQPSGGGGQNAEQGGGQNGQGQQGDQANNQQGGEQPSNSQSDQGQGQDQAQAAQQDDGKKDDGALDMPNGGCMQAVSEHLKRCEKSRKDADLACDPAKDKGIQDTEASSKDTGLLASAKDRSSTGAKMSALDQHNLSTSVKAFAGKCKQKHQRCESSCTAVKKTFAKYCANASAQEKTKASEKVKVAEGSTNGLYCSRDLATKSSQADQQAAVASENAEQHVQTGDQTAGAGGGGGGGGEGMGALLGAAGQMAQQKKAEKEALEKALKEVAAQETLELACQRSQFSGLKECVCRGLSESSCASRMPTSVQGYDPNYLLSSPGQ